MPDVTISYKGKSESAEAAARRVAAANVKAAKESEAAFTASGKKVGTAFSAVGGGGIKSAAGGISALGGSAIGVGIALSGVAVGLTSIVNAGREQLKATRLTEAVLTSTGGAAGVTAQQIESLASSLSRISGVQDEVIQSGENVLLTFTSVRNEVGKGNDVFTQATKASLDMSAALGGDLQSNIIRVGKALQDPVGGLTALRRVGVNVDELSVKVKALVASGNKLGAQKAIIRELGTEFGGAAAAAADPFSKLNVEVDELKESLGKAIIPAMSQFVGLISKAASKIPDLSNIGGSKTGKGGLFDDKNPVGQTLHGLAQAIVFPPGLFLHHKKEQDDVSASSERAAAALRDNAAAAKADAEAYSKLADAASKAVQAASQTVTLRIAVDTASTNFQDAVSALHAAPDAGGGGSGQTAAAAAFEHADKLTAVRDANLQVSRSSQEVANAQHTLATAQQDAAQAAKDVTSAQKNYNTVLNGVADGSRAAKDAQDSYTSALDRSKSASLDLIDAQRSLKDAKDAAAIAGREAGENVGSTGRSVKSAGLDVKDAQAALSRARETEDPETIARAQIALGDAQQRLTDATEANAQAQKDLAEVGKKNSKENEDVKRAQIGVTESQISGRQAAEDLKEAARILDGTLHGFPKTSKEAQEATTNLQTAQNGLYDSTQQVTSAQNGLVDAQNNVTDSNLALQRATADLQGKLEAVGGGAAGKHLDSFQTKLNTVTSAAQSSADSIYANIKNATGSVGQGILAEIAALQFAVAAEPLLKGAFDSEIASLYATYDKFIADKAFDSGKSLVPGAAGHQVLSGTRAGGGSVRAGDAYLIGEHGPEVLQMGSRDGHVVPNHALQNSRPFTGGSAPVIINLYGDIHGVDDLDRRLDEAARKFKLNNGRAPGSVRR